jgi:type II secretory pathway component PulF
MTGMTLPDFLDRLVQEFGDILNNFGNGMSETASHVFVLIFTTALWLIPLLALIYVTYYLLSLPLRRHERARLFLDLIESGLNHGQTIEQSILTAEGSRDKILGKQFQWLAGYLGHGLALSDALRNVPGIVPAQVALMLEAGAKSGELRRVLPAIRRSLADATAKLTGAQNHLMILWFVLNPIGPGILILLSAVIIKRYGMIVEEIAEGHMPLFYQFLVDHRWQIMAIQLSLATAIYVAAILYVGGPRFVNWLGWPIKPIYEWISFHLSWRRQRMQRDFSAMLAILLDAGVAEHEAVRQAGECTVNAIFQSRCQEVERRIQSGTSLTKAMSALDETGEFRWRLTNATHGSGGFLFVLAGWHEALDAKAYQREQAAAQGITTALVLVNGLVVGLIAGGIFQMIQTCVDYTALW